MALITRVDAARFAKITTALSPDQAAVLDDLIAAATPVIEAIAGPVDAGTRTHRAVPCGGPIMLPWPFTAVLSVTVDGETVDPSQYDAATRADVGIVSRAAGCDPWSTGTAVTVTCSVGAVAVPANVRQAALELVAYWWQSTQQSQRSAWNEGGVPMGFAVPRRVTELLAASPTLPGFG